MSRVYGEPVDMWTREGEPFRFVWRERLYVVRRVLEHWVTTRDWWEKAGEAEGEISGEREFWRVEASPGQGSGVYELRFETATGTWLLLRVWD